MSGLRPVDEVLDQLLGLVQPTETTETRKLDDALNCCAAADIQSPVDVPPADNSAMDGYAFNHASTPSDAWLGVSDRIPAGQVGSPLVPGTLARIFTGAPVPDGADTVVMQENTEAEGDRVRVLQLPASGANVRARGQDIRQGSTLIARGDCLNSQHLGLIASVGISEVLVFRPLRVAIMSTGDELVEPGGSLAPGQIFNSNRYALGALLRDMGFEVADLGIVADTPQDTETALAQAARQADVILTTGGVSVGEEDHVKNAVEKLGRLELWKLAIKPGKPLAYGEVAGTPMFGLPGNPVSTFVTFMIVARPYLRAMQGLNQVANKALHLPAGFSFKGGGRREYLRVRTRIDQNGRLVLEKFAEQGSGIMSSVVWADGLAEVDIGQQVLEGDLLKVFPL